MTDKFNLIIAGSRTFADYHIVNVQTAAFLKALKELRAKRDRIQIISGTAKGADQLGERFATQYKLSLLRMPAKWDLYGKSAGYRRNECMAEMANACIVFWDGQSRGSQHMVEQAKEKGIPTTLYNASNQTVEYYNMP
jgi:hypothetical protein